MSQDQTTSTSEDSRRDFLKKAALLAAGMTLPAALAASIQKALAIEPSPGSTYVDAEHVVILMQENRSFDHLFGSLQGVRGFNDPRAISLPNGNPVWLQTDAAGNTYGPFRLDLKNTKATWMGELPHGRKDQGEARNHGKHDRWLVAKPTVNKSYHDVPFTLGYYTREDLPFYYGLADAFTICDQAFCSVIGPTTPNRLHLWTGTVRPEKTATCKAHVQNEDTDFGAEVSWKTFPERLEENGISWKNYQNELAVPSGLEGDSDAWLSNFGDNPLEFFTQYGVYFSPQHRRYLADAEKTLTAELAALESAGSALSDAQQKRQGAARTELEKIKAARKKWTDAAFAQRTAHEKSLHEKAFVTNQAHPDYRELDTLAYDDAGQRHEMRIPKGDVLHQLREDVRTGQLPTVSWIIPPERFSDHPSSPWYGALYLSETLDILTQNPEVWKKTIFILCYDENDGYFDHVPPFVPPRHDRPDTGMVSPGLDTAAEHVREDPTKNAFDDGPGKAGRDGPIGLGYRVPLVIASPWSRGGYVCSEVFDHTSILRFLETFLGQKTEKKIEETNISTWRRAICGDLSSVFRPARGPSKERLPVPLQRTAFLSAIHRAQFRPVPNDFRKWSAEDISRASDPSGAGRLLPQQESGTRPSCALPYELSVNGSLDSDRKSFVVQFGAGKTRFGGRSAGAPFHVYSPAPMRRPHLRDGSFEAGLTRSYAVSAGSVISDHWALEDFEQRSYLLRIHGPNGFFREFRGTAEDPRITVEFSASGQDANLTLANVEGRRPMKLIIKDLTYGSAERVFDLGTASSKSDPVTATLPLQASSGWYDFAIHVDRSPDFGQRYAGRIETGNESITDPHMGRMG